MIIARARAPFTRVRRLVGIVIGVCALHLTVGVLDAQCSDHSPDGSSIAVAPASSHNDTSHDELPAQGAHTKPCKSAAIPCCGAMTSCGATIALGTTDQSQTLATTTHIVPSLRFAQPLSRIAAPEPPPPKA